MYFTLLSILLVSHALANSICTKQHWLYFNFISYKAPRCQQPDTCSMLFGISSNVDNQGEANHRIVYMIRDGLNISFAVSSQSITIRVHFVALKADQDTIQQAIIDFKTHGTWQRTHDDTGIVDENISTITSAKHTNIVKEAELGEISITYNYEVRREDCPLELTTTVATYTTTRTNDISKSSDQEASMMTTTETDSLEYEELSTYDEMTTAPMFVMTIALVISFLMVLNVAWCWIVNPPKPTTKKQRIKLKK